MIHGLTAPPAQPPPPEADLAQAPPPQENADFGVLQGALVPPAMVTRSEDPALLRLARAH